MCAAGKVWITELTLIHKNIRLVHSSQIGQSDAKRIMISLIKTIASVLKVSIYIITSITARLIRLAAILVIMSVSTFKTVVILYRFPQLLCPFKVYCSIVKLVQQEDLVDLLQSDHAAPGLALYSRCVVILILDLLYKFIYDVILIVVTFYLFMFLLKKINIFTKFKLFPSHVIEDTNCNIFILLVSCMKSEWTWHFVEKFGSLIENIYFVFSSFLNSYLNSNMLWFKKVSIFYDFFLNILIEGQN